MKSPETIAWHQYLSGRMLAATAEAAARRAARPTESWWICAPDRFALLARENLPRMRVARELLITRNGVDES